WYIWLSVVAIILVSSYVWDDSIIITVLGFLLSLAVGTKLEFIMAQLALESAHVKGAATGAHLKPRNSLFWFHRPRLLLHIMHFALFLLHVTFLLFSSSPLQPSVPPPFPSNPTSPLVCLCTELICLGKPHVLFGLPSPPPLPLRLLTPFLLPPQYLLAKHQQ
ncbi:unnamed protein product, partial [Closterium sp. Naga37s-1]